LSAVIQPLAHGMILIIARPLVLRKLICVIP